MRGFGSYIKLLSTFKFVISFAACGGCRSRQSTGFISYTSNVCMMTCRSKSIFPRVDMSKELLRAQASLRHLLEPRQYIVYDSE